MIPDPTRLGFFALTALALLVVPGPAVLFIVARSIDHGRRAGLISMLGIQTGGLVHVAAATIGLSSLLVSSALAFEVVKFAGAAYLIVLGLVTLVRRKQPVDAATPPPAADPGRLFRQGVVVNVLNPKTALFFFAFLPQFVDPNAGAGWLQVLTLGLVFIALAVLSDGAYALAAGTFGELLRRSSAFLRLRRYVTGTVFVGLGVATAVSGSARRPS